LVVSTDGATLYASSKDSNLYAINTDTGSKKWDFVTDEGSPSSPRLSKDNSMVYIGSDDRNLYAINTDDGSKKWQYTTGDLVEAAPTLTADGALVLVGSFDSYLYAIHVRCAFFDRNLYSRSAIELHAFAPLEALPCV
jgi:outer membrane protein assembly factor BamB